MKIFPCQCGSSLFFNSLSCVTCSSVTARCPKCLRITALQQQDGNQRYICTGCLNELRLCDNRIQYHACNAAVLADSDSPWCRYCSLNSLLPDLNFEANRVKWQRIEYAKHRVLYDCERIGLPVGDEPHVSPPLRFQFKSSTVEPVVTGHASGLITIDTEEADSVKREEIRVTFDEPQRTLIGHIRHELGHYYWECLVRPFALQKFRAIFGDESVPSYAEALRAYHSHPRSQSWQLNYVSQYASMHPWEDFAECFNTYLDMVAIAANAYYVPVRSSAPPDSFEYLLETYIEIGIFANELNRDIGLPDLVPEVFTNVVVEKLRFIHDLVGAASNSFEVSGGTSQSNATGV